MREACSPLNAKFNRIISDTEKIYSRYAAVNGISPTTQCVLYSLYIAGAPCTQTQLSESWGIPKQTVHSCLKILQDNGMIRMEFAENNRKNKLIHLTAQGEALTDRIIAPIIRAENAALQALTEEEQQLYMALNRKHAELLKHFLLSDQE